MKPQASVTVLLLNFNQAQFASDSWESLEKQSVAPSQVLVIDDGSKPSDVEVIQKLIEYTDLQTELIVDGKNLGHTARMNQAILMCKSKFFLLLSADDWLEPDAIKSLLEGMEDGIDVVWGNLRVVNQDGSTRGYSRPRENWQGPIARKYLDGGYVFRDILKVNNFISGGMTLMRTDVIKNAGLWDEEVTTEDLEMWLKIGKSSKFKYIDTIIGNYRIVKNSKSRSDSNKLLDHSKIFQKYYAANPHLGSKFAYLASMRWALSLGRNRKIPNVSLRNMARIIGLPVWRMYIALPRAVFNPIWGSLVAYAKKKTSL